MPTLREAPKDDTVTTSTEKPGFYFPEDESNKDVAQRPDVLRLNQPLAPPDLY